MTELPHSWFGERDNDVNYVVRPCAYAVIVSRESVLLVQGSGGGWYFPGGGLMEGEPSEIGLQREIGEEIGCSARLGPMFACAVQLVFSADEKTHFELHADYYAASLDIDLPTGGEHHCEWIATERAGSILVRPADSWALQTYLTRSTGFEPAT